MCLDRADGVVPRRLTVVSALDIGGIPRSYEVRVVAVFCGNVLDLILIYFTDLVGALVGMIFQIFVWRSPKGHCYGNQ